MKVVINNLEERQIVTSYASSVTLFVGVHFPFGHTPVVDDLFYIWSHKYACTAPIRLIKETELTHGIPINALKADPILSSPIFKNTGTITNIDGDATTVTVTCVTTAVTNHNLTTNDNIEITNTAFVSVNMEGVDGLFIHFG